MDEKDPFNHCPLLLSPKSVSLSFVVNSPVFYPIVWVCTLWNFFTRIPGSSEWDPGEKLVPNPHPWRWEWASPCRLGPRPSLQSGELGPPAPLLKQDMLPVPCRRVFPCTLPSASPTVLPACLPCSWKLHWMPTVTSAQVALSLEIPSWWAEAVCCGIPQRLFRLSARDTYLCPCLFVHGCFSHLPIRSQWRKESGSYTILWTQSRLFYDIAASQYLF